MRLEHIEFSSDASQYQSSLPVAGSKPHTSPGTPITSSLRPPGSSTRIGVPQVELNPSALLLHTTRPSCLSSATIAWLSTVAGTISRLSQRIGLEADPQLRESSSVPTLW